MHRPQYSEVARNTLGICFVQPITTMKKRKKIFLPPPKVFLIKFSSGQILRSFRPFEQFRLHELLMIFMTSFSSISFRILKEANIIFYYVKYGSSIITSKIPSKILSNENMKTGVSRNIVCLWHLSSRFVLKTTETPFFIFITEIF